MKSYIDYIMILFDINIFYTMYVYLKFKLNLVKKNFTEIFGKNN